MSADKINDTSAHDDLAAYQPEKYCHNIEHQGAEGIGTGGEDHFKRTSGGGDDAGLTDSNMGAGGKELGL